MMDHSLWVRKSPCQLVHCGAFIRYMKERKLAPHCRISENGDAGKIRPLFDFAEVIYLTKWANILNIVLLTSLATKSVMLKSHVMTFAVQLSFLFCSRENSQTSTMYCIYRISFLDKGQLGCHICLVISVEQYLVLFFFLIPNIYFSQVT